jgi:hypothetical protein
VDILEQLSAALPSTEEDVKNVLRRKTKTIRKLELKLADRRRLSKDGYATVSCGIFLYICHPGPQDSWYPSTVFSEGNGCKHLTIW